MSNAPAWTNATVDGVPIGDDYGIRIRPADEPVGALRSDLKIGRPLEAWLTWLQEQGWYLEIERLPSTAVISGWTDTGAAFEFRDGLLTIRAVSGDDESEGK